MGDVGLIVILAAAFALAVGLVQLLGRLINSGAQDDWADEPPDTDGIRALPANPDVTRPGRPR